MATITRVRAGLPAVAGRLEQALLAVPSATLVDTVTSGDTVVAVYAARGRRGGHPESLTVVLTDEGERVAVALVGTGGGGELLVSLHPDPPTLLDIATTTIGDLR